MARKWHVWLTVVCCLLCVCSPQNISPPCSGGLALNVKSKGVCPLAFSKWAVMQMMVILTHWVCNVSFECRSKLMAVKQTLALSPYVLWLDADALFARFDAPVSLAYCKSHFAARYWVVLRKAFELSGLAGYPALCAQIHHQNLSLRSKKFARQSDHESCIYLFLLHTQKSRRSV